MPVQHGLHGCMVGSHGRSTASAHPSVAIMEGWEGKKAIVQADSAEMIAI